MDIYLVVVIIFNVKDDIFKCRNNCFFWFFNEEIINLNLEVDLNVEYIYCIFSYRNYIFKINKIIFIF